jgi:dTDP-4-dehydrorhamnose reductase
MAGRALVTGATGQLGAYLVRELVGRGVAVTAWGHSRPAPVFGVTARPVDLTDPGGLAAAFAEARPGVVLHAAAVSAVGDCARDPERAEAVNGGGTAALGALCERVGIRLVYVSTDLVFDGERPPYSESSPVNPLSVYGRSKATGERAVLSNPRNVVARVSLLFGPSRNGRPNFFDSQVAALREGRPLRLFHDEWRTPLGLATAARALAEIATSDVAGLLHVGGPERMSRVEMGHRLAAHLGINRPLTEPISRRSVPGEPRPRDTSLDSSRWRVSFPACSWPTFEQSLDQMVVR